MQTAEPLEGETDTGRQWYVANTYHRREIRAKSEVENLGFKTFLPMEIYRARLNLRRTVVKTKPLFPRYLFIKFKIEKSPWGYIMQCSAIRRMLEAGGKPRAVPGELIKSLRGAEEIGLFDQTTAHLRMDPGDDLLIIEGPFTRCMGIIEDIGTFL